VSKTRIVLWASLALFALAPGMRAAPPVLTHRWFYANYNLQVDSNVKIVQELLRRAKSSGYNGIVFADYKLGLLDKVPARYFKNAETVRQTAEKLGMEIVPAVCPIGYSNNLLSHDPNLAEGQPVKDAVFSVKNGCADILQSPASELKGGGFESARENKFAGWDYQDFPGTGTFADKAVKHGGLQSMRIEDIGKADPKHGHGRIHQKVQVFPFRQYHLSVWIKADGFETPGSARATVLGLDGRPICYNKWRIRRTQDWVKYDSIFNSLDNREVRIYLGVWGGKGGKLWLDDAALEEVGLLNVLRRPGCPLMVKSEDGTAYEEGRDFEPVKDEQLNAASSHGYEVYHTPPIIRLTPGSRIQEGQRLLVSFYHNVIINLDQVTCCLSEPAVYDLLKDQMSRVNSLFHPKAFLLSYDEIRVANWCEACRKRNLTPGQLLADSVRRCIEIVRQVSPKAGIYVWSDMFDPYHNSHDNYYLVNGTWAGSCEGMPKDVSVLNWNFDERKESMAWFAKQGHCQILAGYYDNEPGRIRQWLEDSSGIPNIVGAMYTTWKSNYQDLEGFARSAWDEPGSQTEKGSAQD
jgi:hypothetical protein